MERLKNTIIAVALLTFVMSGLVWAKPVNKTDAEKAIKGWLKADAKPLDMALGGQVKKVDTYNDANGQPAYHIVYLKPTGFVIVAADDVVEPIIGFVNSDKYDLSPQNPLKILVELDIPNRIAHARTIEQEAAAKGKDKLTAEGKAVNDSSVKAKGKWVKLQAYADSPLPPTLGSISDVRVATLVASRWNQDEAYGGDTGYCYDYYTPSHYPCGCVATAFAQVVRYFMFQPAGGIGVHSFPITISGSATTASTRGGNGTGGAYNWSDMVLVPNSSITTTQRQAIGALTYDCGVTVEMGYSSGGSGAYMHYVARSLKDIFKFSNAFITYHDWYSKDTDILGMINPNLDASLPVLFSVWDGGGGEHAIVCDGYGYQSSTMYHHINMGWGGSDDAWYNIPDIDGFIDVDSVTYNIYTSGTGEIISGRVTSSGVPITGASITASGTGGPYTTTTNSKGIYALTKVGSNSTYTIHVSKSGYAFDDQIVTTGTSVDGSRPCGNKWGIDFEPNNAVPTPPAPAISVDFEAGTPAGWDYYDPAGDIDRNLTVDLNDLNLMAQYWLSSSCGVSNQWCGRADIDQSSDVTFTDYARFAANWTKQGAQNVLVQTIYGTAQDSNGTITADTYRPLNQVDWYGWHSKGMALAFAVDANTVLDKARFKCSAGSWTPGKSVRVRLFNVTGKGYLTYGHSMPIGDPGSGSTAIIDYTKVTPDTVPYHYELNDGRQYTNLVIDFNSCEVTSGQYLLVFDSATTGTWGSMVRGLDVEASTMGKYADGTTLPKGATVTTSLATGNVYYYEITSGEFDTMYTAYSNMFACQILTTNNRRPSASAGTNQLIIQPTNTANLDGTVSDDGKPNPPGVVTAHWTKENGPGTVTFGDANAVDTTVTIQNGAFGNYVLRLTVSDSELSASSEVTILYYASTPTNQAPDVNVGPDFDITLPSNATLDATVTDDGLPIPPGKLITTWTTQEGPAQAVFGNASNVDTMVTFPIDGFYILRLTAYDGELTSYSDLWINVYAAPPSPPASITYPASNIGWDFTVSWSSVTGATSYELDRSSDGGSTWGQVYSGTVASYAEHISGGSYRYRVKALNGSSSSDWTTGTYDCVVTIPPPPPWSDTTADYYVDGPSGTDLGTGTSTQPFKTFAKAVSAATAGQKVLVWGDQTYSGYTSFTISGTSSSPITFKRDPSSGTVVLDGAAATKGVLDTTTAGYIVIDGFKLTNAKFGVRLSGVNCTGWVIKNCRVTANTNNGISIDNGDGNLLFNDTIYLNDSGNNGIDNTSNALNTNVVQCSIYGQKMGVYAGSGGTVNVMDSIIANNTTYGVRKYGSGSTITITSSDVWHNNTDYSGVTAGTGCINSDPKFVNPAAGDFNLQSGSPAHNTASDGGDMGYRYNSSAL